MQIKLKFLLFPLFFRVWLRGVGSTRGALNIEPPSSEETPRVFFLWKRSLDFGESFLALSGWRGRTYTVSNFLLYFKSCSLVVSDKITNCDFPLRRLANRIEGWKAYGGEFTCLWRMWAVRIRGFEVDIDLRRQILRWCYRRIAAFRWVLEAFVCLSVWLGGSFLNFEPFGQFIIKNILNNLNEIF